MLAGNPVSGHGLGRGVGRSYIFLARSPLDIRLGQLGRSEVEMDKTTNTYTALNAGDLSKCNVLFLRHRRDLEGYFRRRHPRLRGETGDHLHEAFRLFVERAEKAKGMEFLEKDKFVPYMKAILENLIRDLWRSVSQRPELVSIDDTDGGLRGGIQDENARSPLSEVEKEEQLRRVKEAYLDLDASDREILTLWMLGHNYEEMSRILGRSIAALCTRKSRVMKGLRRLLNRNGDHDESKFDRIHAG